MCHSPTLPQPFRRISCNKLEAPLRSIKPQVLDKWMENVEQSCKEIMFPTFPVFFLLHEQWSYLNNCFPRQSWCFFCLHWSMLQTVVLELKESKLWMSTSDSLCIWDYVQSKTNWIWIQRLSSLVFSAQKTSISFGEFHCHVWWHRRVSSKKWPELVGFSASNSEGKTSSFVGRLHQDPLTKRDIPWYTP